MPSPYQPICATGQLGGQEQDGPGVEDQPAEIWDGLPRGGDSWSNLYLYLFQKFTLLK